MNSTSHLPKSSANAEKPDLHKTLSFGPGKELKNQPKLNENSLAAKPKSIHQGSAVNLNGGQQQADTREFGREITTNKSSTTLLSAPTSAVRHGKVSQLNNQAPGAKVAQTEKVSFCQPQLVDWAVFLMCQNLSL